MAEQPVTSFFDRRYRIIDELGRGTMGVVYRAHDLLLGIDVAVKRFLRLPHYLADPHEQAPELTIAREFRILASLRHPHIISVLDYGFTADQEPYFTMQLMHDARLLHDVLHDLPLDGKLSLIYQVLQGLDYLHRHNIIHRDLKPQNVAVTALGRAVIFDFGLASHASLATGDTGTLRYRAPEVIRRKGATPSSDLYAVGVMLYEALTGRHPFAPRGVGIRRADVLTKPPDLKPIYHCGPRGEQIATVIGRLLEKVPANRYQTAVEALDELSAASGVPSPVETPRIRESFLQAARFVGRDSELNSLNAAMEGAANGMGGAWLIAGESGVGKSRLLEELRVRGLVNGFQVVQVNGLPGVGYAHLLWRSLLPPLLLQVPVSDSEAALLKPIIPMLTRLLGREVTDPPALDRDFEQQQLTEVMVNIVARTRIPILLLADDAHYFQDSARPLQRLAQQADRLPILIVAAFQLEASPDLPTLIPEAHLIRLPRLNPAEVEALSTAILGEPGKSEQLVAWLLNQTDGNAFFVVEVLRALADSHGRLADVLSQALPASVSAHGISLVLERRLKTLQFVERSLLHLAAVLGRNVDLTVLKHAADTIDLDDWLLRCSVAALLEFNQGTWRFVHDKIRDYLLSGESWHRGFAGLHLKAAAALEACYPDQPEYLGRIAFHYRMAGKLEKAAGCAIRAAHAASAGDLAAALRTLDSIPRSRLSRDLRLHVLLTLSQGHELLRDTASADRYFEEALRNGLTARPGPPTLTLP